MDTAVIASILNFSLVVGILYFGCRKPLAQFLNDRSSTISREIEEAGKLAKESGIEKEKWERLSTVKILEVANLRREAETMLTHFRKASISGAEKEAARIEREVGLVAEAEYKRAKQNLVVEFSQGAAELARTHLANNLKPDAVSGLLGDTLERVHNA